MKLFISASRLILWTAFGLLLACAELAQAQFAVNSPATEWVPVPYRASAVVDFNNDQVNTGTGEFDVVGNTSLPAFYTKFAPGASSTTGTLYYRVRIGKGGGGDYPKILVIGIDANQDGKVDLFVGTDNDIRIWKPKAAATQISPATTALDTVIKKYGRNTTNYKWAAVNTVSNKPGINLDPEADTAPEQDLNSNGNTDYFLSFSLPFADLVAALGSRGISFNSATPVTYVLGTSNDDHGIKQDLAGASGGTTSALPFASLGVLTQPMLVDGTVTNRAPVNTVPTGPLTVNVSRAINGVSVADVDCNLGSVQVTASTGYVSVNLTGGAVIMAGANNSATFTLGGTIAQINAALATLGYTAPVGYTGPATVTVVSKDSSDATATSTIPLIVINTTNTVPVAADDLATTHSGKPVTVYVTGNDTDPDVNILAVNWAMLSAGQGTIAYADGNVTYTPTSTFVGTATIPYTISDGNGGTSSATLSVTVTPNRNPVVVNDSKNASVSTVIGIEALANDSDPDGDTLTITNATRTSGGGSVAVLGDLIEFTAPGTFGTTTISYTISDGYGGTASGTITIVTGSNSNPVALDDTATATSGLSTSIDVLANDSDANGDSLWIADVTLLSGSGVALAVNEKVLFTPDADFIGTATISYTIDDGRTGTATATITVTVADATPPTISGPFSPLTLTTGANGTVALPSYVSQAVTSDNVAVTSIVQSPTAGSARVVGETTVTLTATDASGNMASTSFSVTVADGTAPTISGSFSPLTLTVDAGGTVALPSYGSQAATSDNVAVTSVTQSPEAGSALGIGTTTVVLTARDAAGNFASTSFVLTVNERPPTAPPETQSATRVTPGSALIHCRLNPGGVETWLSIEYSKDPSLSGAATTTPVPVGSGTSEVTKGIPLTNLDPNTRYYYRAVHTNSTGIVRGQIESFLTPVIEWGAAGASVSSGQLDATRIPSTAAATTYTNVSGRGYDIEVTTSALGGSGHTLLGGQSSWWLEGSGPTASAPATVRVRFYETGTRKPFGVMGVRFRIDDAEQMETLLNFSYYTETGEWFSLPWNSPIFTYSHAPIFGAGYHSVENGAPYEGMSQSGKWVDVNLSGLFVSGFEFQLKRRSGSAGSVIMSAIAPERSVISVAGDFAPLVLDTDSSGSAVVPDYTQQASVNGAPASATLTQNPVAGSLASVGKKQISICAADTAGHTSRLGFEVLVRDKTAPVVAKKTSAWAPATLTSLQAMPDFTKFMSASDNVAVTRLEQSPAAGSIINAGTTPITIFARDAAGNVGTFTFPVTADSSSFEGQGSFSSIAAKGSLVPGGGAMGIPEGAVFRSFGIPSINDSGATAFIGTWIQGRLTGKTVLAGNPVQPIASLAQPAPGIAGATFSLVRDPALNSGGTSDAVAFLADVTGTGITTVNNTGLWSNFGGELQLLARENAPAPGTSARFKAFTAINVYADEVLITASLAGAGVTTSNDAGVWSWTADHGMKLILREGQHVLAGKTVATIRMLIPVAGSMGHGRHHLDKGFHAARITCTNGSSAAIFLDCTGSSPVVLPAAVSREAIVPGAMATSIGTPSGNAGGDAAFTAQLSTGPAVIFSRSESDGSRLNRIVVRRGDEIAPGIAWYTFRDPITNAENVSVWLGQISGATSADNDVLAFAPEGGAPAILAREGDAAPGTDSVFHSFTSVALPDGATGPLFSAKLRVGTGTVTTANDTGLWAVSATGELVLLLREGKVLGSRAIRGFQTIEYVAGSPDQARSYNSTGSIIALVTFTDGSQSIVQIELP